MNDVIWEFLKRHLTGKFRISVKFNSIQLLQAANMHCHSSFEFGKPCKSFHLMHRFYEKHAMYFDILHILHIWKSIMFDSNEIHFLIVFYAKLCYFGSHEIMDCWQPISTWILHAIRSEFAVKCKGHTWFGSLSFPFRNDFLISISKNSYSKWFKWNQTENNH